MLRLDLRLLLPGDKNVSGAGGDRHGVSTVPPYPVTKVTAVSHLHKILALTSAVVVSTLLVGCGAVPGATGPMVAGDGGLAIAQLGFGAEGGTQPALVKRKNGDWLMVYVGTNVGERHLYWTRSQDGTRWSAPAEFAAAEYSDQAPALVEDADGLMHCYFASNRGGDNFELFHTTFDGAWAEPTRIAGYTAVQDLAAAYTDGRFLLAAEVTAEGLFAATSTDGTTFGGRERIAMAGFDPAAAFLPDGSTLVAYTRGNELLARAGTPDVEWTPEQVVVAASDRVRGPALAWAGDHGKLIYTERTNAGTSYRLREKRFGADRTFAEGTDLAPLGGAHSPAVAPGAHAEVGLAWGMKLSSGQQGVAFTLDGWK